STSGNDGEYTLTVTFKAGVNPDFAQMLVQNRVNLAVRELPDEVKKAGVITRKKVGDNGWKELLPEASPNQVVIALIDRGDNGPLSALRMFGDWEGLQKAASVVVKRLTAEGALTKPQVFPRDEKVSFSFQVDPAKCKSLGVTAAEVTKAVQAW